jgi:hypothetical protein
LLGISRLHGQEFGAEVAEPVEAAALLAARRPRSALGWLRTSGGGQILAGLLALLRSES